jgi:drug/metabolite transporter (DMT)-like permease
MPPFWSLTLRLCLGFLFLAALALGQRTNFRVIRQNLWLVLGLGLFTHTVSYSLVYWGEQYVTSGLAAVLFSCMPFFVALFSPRFLPGDPVSRVTWLGLVIGFTGLLLVYWTNLEFGGEHVLLGMACITASGLIAASTTVIIKKRLGHAPAIALAASTIAVGAALQPLVAVATEPITAIHLTPAALATVLYLGVCGSGITFVLYYKLLSRLPALTMSLIAFITPVVALLLAVAFDQEVHTSRSLVGIAMVLSGVLLAAIRVKTTSPNVRSR